MPHTRVSELVISRKFLFVKSARNESEILSEWRCALPAGEGGVGGFQRNSSKLSPAITVNRIFCIWRSAAISGTPRSRRSCVSSRPCSIV